MSDRTTCPEKESTRNSHDRKYLCVVPNEHDDVKGQSFGRGLSVPVPGLYTQPMPSKSHLARRQLLAVLSGGIAGLAGCIATSNRDVNENTTSAPSSDDSDPSATDDLADESEPNEETEPAAEWVIADPGAAHWVNDSDWRMSGHDTANTFRNRAADGPAADPTVQWTFDPNISTLFELEHHPVIVDGTVYTRRAAEHETDAAEDASFELVAIDGETGDVDTLLETTQLLSRPCVTEESIYVAVDSGEQAAVHAYDRESMTKRWETDELVYDPFTIHRVADTVLVTEADPRYGVNEDLEIDPERGSSELFAIDAETGKLRWDARGIGPNMLTDYGFPLATTTVAVFEGTRTARQLDDGARAGTLPALPFEDATRLSDALFEDTLLTIGHTDNTFLVAAADWQTFEPRWSRSFSGSRAGGRPTVVDGIVAVPQPDERAVLGLDFETGETEWRAEPDIAPDHDDLPATLVAGANTFFGVLPGGGAFALDPDTGTVRWELRTDSMTWSPTSGVALADDLLVVTGSDGKLFAIA